MTTEIKSVPKDQIPCKFFSDYWEDVAGDGGPQMYFSDCGYEGDIDMSEGNCNPQCPAYKPVEVCICKKHNREYVDICIDCETEWSEARG